MFENSDNNLDEAKELSDKEYYDGNKGLFKLYIHRIIMYIKVNIVNNITVPNRNGNIFIKVINMKRFLAVAALSLMMLLAFTSCNGNDNMIDETFMSSDTDNNTSDTNDLIIDNNNSGEVTDDDGIIDDNDKQDNSIDNNSESTNNNNNSNNTTNSDNTTESTNNY